MKKSLMFIVAIGLLVTGMASLANAGPSIDELALIPSFDSRSPNVPDASTVTIVKDANSRILADYSVDIGRYHHVNFWDLSDLSQGKATLPGVDNLPDILHVIISADKENHRIGDYAPLYLVAKDGSEVIIGYNRGDKETDVFHYTLDRDTKEWASQRTTRKIE